MHCSQCAFLEIFSYSLILDKHCVHFLFSCNLCVHKFQGSLLLLEKRGGEFFFVQLISCQVTSFQQWQFQTSFFAEICICLMICEAFLVDHSWSASARRAEPKENICMAKEQIVNIRSFYGPPQCRLSLSTMKQGAAVQIAWLFKHEKPDS